MTTSTPIRDRAQIPAELLLALVSLVAVSGFSRLFSDRGAVWGLLVAVVAAHLASAVARRRGLGALGTVGLVVVAFTFQASFVLYPHHSLAGLPTAATLSAAVEDLRQAWALFGEVRAPAPSERGFLLAATVAIWLAVSLADWAALRIRATAEALLPTAALYVFTLLLGRGVSSSLLTTAALVMAALGFALAQRTARAAVDDIWITGRIGPGIAAQAGRGAAAILVVTVVASVAVPLMPGTRALPLVDWNRDERSSRTTISPLVDIRSRLVQQSDAVVFRVRADRPAYWRLTSLDRFDGQLWSFSATFSQADGRLPSTPPEAATEELVQSYNIVALNSLWAPAALTPVDLRESTTELRWNSTLTTLIVPDSVESIDGARYQVVSQVPRLTPLDLDRTLPDPLPRDLAEATQLPDDLPPEMAALAREVTAGVPPTPYALALALQNWFRRDFTYDLGGVGAGHGEHAISVFLATRRGYCEQFAGTFAAMARSLGLPARVAVGFTPGEVDAAGTTYTVRGRNAHAWPEVFVPDVGWVPFEPTPGRGQPGAEIYTGVAPAQDDADPLPIPPTTADPSPAGPGEVPPSSDPGDPSSSTEPRSDVRVEAPSTGPSGGSPGGRGPELVPVVLAGLATLAGLAVLGLGALGVLRVVHRRRRRQVTEVVARIRAAWSDVVAITSRLGGPPAPAETDSEYAARAAPSVGPAAPALTRLAALVTRTTWAPIDDRVDPALAIEADDLARQVVEEAHRRLTRPQRLWAQLDPRVVWQAW